MMRTEKICTLMDTPDQLERGLQQAKEDLTLHLERLDDSGQEFLEDLMLL